MLFIPVGVCADADAALVGRPRLPPEAVGLGVLVAVGVGDRKDVPEEEERQLYSINQRHRSKQIM